MERDEETREDATEEGQGLERPSEVVPVEPGTEAGDDRAWGDLGRYVPAAGVSAAVLLFALAFFLAGFWVHAVLDEDEGGVTTAATSSDDPAWGPEDAAVTIVEFGDFQCPYCGRFAHEALPALRSLYGDRVRYVYRDFPIVSIHEFAQKAAEAAQCAHEQGRFWQYHDLLFANQSALTVLDLKEYARQVEMDSEAFDECLDSGKNAWEVLLDTRDGAELGVTGTPAFLINGVLIPGALPLEQFEAIINQALAGAE